MLASYRFLEYMSMPVWSCIAYINTRVVDTSTVGEEAVDKLSVLGCLNSAVSCVCNRYRSALLEHIINYKETCILSVWSDCPGNLCSHYITYSTIQPSQRQMLQLRWRSPNPATSHDRLCLEDVKGCERSHKQQDIGGLRLQLYLSRDHLFSDATSLAIESRKSRVPSIAKTWKHVWLTQRAKDWASTKEMLWIGLIGTCCLFMVSCLEDCTVYSIFWCIGHHSFEFSLFAILSFCFEFFPVRSSSARNEETHEFYTEGWIERWVTWASCKGIHRYWSNLISLLISIARGQRMKSAFTWSACKTLPPP